MQIAWIIRSFAVVLGFAVLAAGARADEEKVPLGKLPKAVLQSVKKRFPDAEMKQAGKEIEAGKTVYEVSIKDKGHRIDVSLTPEGTILELEREIEAKDLPRAVAQALQTKYAQATYITIEEVIKVQDGKEKLEYYEVTLVTAGNKKMEVTVTPKGQLRKEEDKSKAKD
jgi:hypothetical protein